ncbi:hypothetical protein JCM1840_004777 [Sporobolomyces johnsonii]
MTVPLRSSQPKIPPYLPDRNNYKPTHPGLVKVEFGEEGKEFASCLRTEKAFRAGETLCPIRNTLPGTKAYSSVQVLPDPPLPASFSPTSSPLPSTYYSTPSSSTVRRHIELNSDLLYVNHSCDPNVRFDVNGVEASPDEEDPTGTWTGKWAVRALKDLAAGEILTFAYFSSEWDMDQPFACLCGTARCLGTIRGARDMDKDVLDSYFVNNHIKAMKAHQIQTQQSNAALSSSKVAAGKALSAAATEARREQSIKA